MYCPGCKIFKELSCFFFPSSHLLYNRHCSKGARTCYDWCKLIWSTIQFCLTNYIPTESEVLFTIGFHQSVHKRPRSNIVSNKVINSCRVSLGWVLRPLLFLILINDIPNSSYNLKFYLFAGDTITLYADNDPKCIEATVNKELQGVWELLQANKLTLK